MGGGRMLGWIRWSAVGAVLVAAVVGAYLFFVPQRTGPERAPTPPSPALPAAAPAASPAEPAVAFPLPGEPAEASMQAPAVAPPDAQAAFERELSSLADPSVLARFVDPASLVRRVVSTADNIATDALPMRSRAVASIGGSFVVTGSGDALAIAPANAARYEPFVRLLESIEPRRVGDLYLRHYRLFQGEYRGQGSPDRYFNDRLVAAIDHLLATPKVDGPVLLVQPKVLYRYADPALEALSVGQKALIRTGPDNAARIKAWLRALRAEIVRRDRAPASGR